MTNELVKLTKLMLLLAAKLSLQQSLNLGPETLDVTICDCQNFSMLYQTFNYLKGLNLIEKIPN